MTVRSKSKLAGLALGLASALSGAAAVIQVPADYPTIQAAVNAAVSGDEIQIAPGVYTQQTVISHKNLTLTGAPGAVIRAWPGMAISAQYQWYNLVEITAANVTVQGLEFEGERMEGAFALSHHGFAALFYAAASGRVQDCAIQGFRGTNKLASLNSMGFVNWNPVSLGGGVVNLELLHNTFADNATSIWLAGDWQDNPALLRTTFNVESNTISGIGPTSLDNQLGIAIVCGAGGVVKSNRITDHYHSGATILDSSHGIAAYDRWRLGTTTPLVAVQVVHYEGNTLVNNQRPIGAALANGSQFINNWIEGPGGGLTSVGLSLSGTNILAGTNHFASLTQGILLLGNDPIVGTALGIASNVTLASNRFCNVTNSVVIEPLVAGVTEQGTLTCPFPPPRLEVAAAVLLSWPNDGETHTLESAPNLAGPWSLMNAIQTVQDGQVTVSVKADGQRQFFRLR